MMCFSLLLLWDTLKSLNDNESGRKKIYKEYIKNQEITCCIISCFDAITCFCLIQTPFHSGEDKQKMNLSS